MNRLVCLSCVLLLFGCGEKAATKPTTEPEPASPPAAQTTVPPKETVTVEQTNVEHKETVAAETKNEKTTKSLVGTWEGQSVQVQLRMEFGADGTIIESAKSGDSWKQVNKGTFKVITVDGDTVTLEIEPAGKPSYRQTDVFDGADKFHHKHGDKDIPFVRK